MAEAIVQQNYPAQTWKVAGLSNKSQVYPAQDAKIVFTSDSTLITCPSGIYLKTLGEVADSFFFDLTLDSWLVVIPKVAISGHGPAVVVSATHLATLRTYIPTGDWAIVRRIQRVNVLNWQPQLPGTSGRVIMTPGYSQPPIPEWNSDGTDWLYGPAS